MLALSDALHSRMNGDGTLTAMLGQWDGAPAIFTQRPLPADAGRPLVLAVATASDSPDDLYVSQGRRVQRDIVVYGKQPENHDAVINAAERIRALFHRQRLNLAVQGFETWLVHASGPIDAPVDRPDEIGRLVTLTIGLRAA